MSGVKEKNNGKNNDNAESSGRRGKSREIPRFARNDDVVEVRIGKIVDARIGKKEQRDKLAARFGMTWAILSVFRC